MNINPIHSERDYEAALAEVDRLWDAATGTDEGDKRDLLVTLIEKYEEDRWPINAPNWDPVDVLHYAIEEMGHSQAELAEILGHRPRASEILNRHRPLTVEMIHKISERWKIPAELLVKPYKAFA